MKVYVIHYTPLRDRKIHIKKLFKEMNLEPEFIVKYDRENLEEFENQYEYNEQRWKYQLNSIKDILLSNSRLKKNDDIEGFVKNRLLLSLQKFINPSWMKSRILTPAEISLSLKHFFVLSRIKESLVLHWW